MTTRDHHIEKAAFAQREKLGRNAHPHEVAALVIEQLNAAPVWFDWTAKDGPSNGSDLFNDVACDVESIIRESASALINGRANDVARVIVAHFAHQHKFVPTKETPRR